MTILTFTSWSPLPPPLLRLHAGRNLHVELPPSPLPTGAATGRARLAADVAGAVARRARLFHLHGECLAGPGERLFQCDLDAGLHVVAAPARLPATEAASATEQILEVHPAALAAPATRALAATQVTEDGAEEVGEVADVAALVLHAETTARLIGGLLGVALPVGAERVVATALLRVGEHLV